MTNVDWASAAHSHLMRLREIASSVGRADLVAEVDDLTPLLIEGPATVAVIGGYQAGKTRLIGSILGCEIGSTGPMGTTTRTVVIAHGESPAIDIGTSLIHVDLHELADRVNRVEVEPGESMVVFVPSPLLAEGLALIDTPGCAAFGGGVVSAAMSALPVTDAVLFVCSATQPLTAAEVDIISLVSTAGGPVLVTASKADLQVDNDEMLRLDNEALLSSGVDVTVVAVSAELRELALEREDDDIDQESGVDRVIDWLLDDVRAPIERIRRQRLVDGADDVISSLRHPLDIERAALFDDQLAAATVNDLDTQVRGLQKASSRWSQQLTDQMTDLRAAADADLRRRGRGLLEVADARIAETDPHDDWDAFEGWFEEQTANEMAAHLTWRHERLTESLERGISDVGALLMSPSLANGAHTSSLDRALKLSALPARTSLRTTLYASLRGSYGGVMMFGFIGSVAGMVLSAPATVGIGLVLGGRNLREERAKQLTSRRAAARAAVRAASEAAWASFGAETRTQMVQLQRSLRDDLSTHVDRSLADARAAHEAARSAAAQQRSDRSRRVGAIDGLLGELEACATDRARLLSIGRESTLR